MWFVGRRASVRELFARLESLQPATRKLEEWCLCLQEQSRGESSVPVRLVASELLQFLPGIKDRLTLFLGPDVLPHVQLLSDETSFMALLLLLQMMSADPYDDPMD